MHKYDYYIQDYLMSQGAFSAENIGEFIINKGNENNGAPVVNFRYDKHAGTTNELVLYIAEKEHKSKVVIGFDLEAHFNEVRQFMNTGKPWLIPAIGQVQMNRNREYEFVPQEQEELIEKERKRMMQASHPSNEYGLQRNEAGNSNKTGAILLTILVVAALGFAGYYLYSNKSEDTAKTSTVTDTAATQTDTMVQVPSSSNINSTTTATAPPATQNNEKPAAATGTTTQQAHNGAMDVRFIIDRTTSPVYAYKRFNQLKSYGISLSMDSIKRDTSTMYKLYITKALSSADTAKTKDSLSVYFGKPVRIELAKQ